MTTSPSPPPHPSLVSTPTPVSVSTSTSTTPPAAPAESATLKDVSLIIGIIAALLLILFNVKSLPELYTRVTGWLTNKRSPSPIVTLPNSPRLIDRVDDVARIHTVLKDHAFISVCGVAGVGKSSVALAAASESARRNPTPRNVRQHLWVDSRDSPLELTDLARTLAVNLNRPELSAAPLSEKADMLRQLLVTTPITMLLDNVASPVTPDQHAFYDFLLHLPAPCRAIVTWQDVQPRHGPRIDLSDLAFEDARSLFERELSDANYSSVPTPEDFALVYEAVGGNPQALRLLARDLATGIHPIQQLAFDVAHDHAQLPAYVKHRIWSRTTPDQRACLFAIADASGESDATFLGACTGVVGARLATSLQALFEAGLITRTASETPTLFSVPNLIRSSVLTNTSAQRKKSIRHRIGLAYCIQFENDWENAHPLMSDPERVLRIMRNLKDSQDCALFLRLFSATLDPLFTAGLLDDRISLGHMAVDCARQIDDPTAEALAWSVISSTHAVRSEHDLAEEAVRQGAVAAYRSSSQADVCYHQRCHAYALYRSGQVRKAVQELEGWVERTHASGDIKGEIDILALLSAAALHEDRIEDAQAHIRLFQERVDDIGWERARAYPLRDLAEVHLRQHKAHDSLTLCRQSIKIAKQYTDQRQICRTLLTSGRALLLIGNPQNARSDLSAALALAKRLGMVNERTEIEATLKLTSWYQARIRRSRTRCAISAGMLTDLPIAGD